MKRYESQWYLVEVSQVERKRDVELAGMIGRRSEEDQQEKKKAKIYNKPERRRPVR